MNNEDIKALADLSRLHIKETDIENYKKDFEGILNYINTLKNVEVNISQDDISRQHINILREDTVAYTSGEHTDELLAAAPERENDFIKVNKVL